MYQWVSIRLDMNITYSNGVHLHVCVSVCICVCMCKLISIRTKIRNKKQLKNNDKMKNIQQQQQTAGRFIYCLYSLSLVTRRDDAKRRTSHQPTARLWVVCHAICSRCGFSLFVLVAGVVVAAEFAVFFFVQLIVLLILLGFFFYFCDTLRLVNKQQQLQQ